VHLGARGGELAVVRAAGAHAETDSASSASRGGIKKARKRIEFVGGGEDFAGAPDKALIGVAVRMQASRWYYRVTSTAFPDA
jgi:hypothetical protein